MIAECAACERVFNGLTAFDAHQSWDYSKPPGDQLTCLDPAALLTKDGKPRFRLNARGRWGSADEMPSGALRLMRGSAEQPASHTPTPTTAQNGSGPCTHCGPIASRWPLEEID